MFLRVAILLLLGLSLSGCLTTESVLATQRVIVVVKPNPLSYEQCPQSIDLPATTDTNSEAKATRMIYSAYSSCRQALNDIRKEIDDLETTATKDNPKK